MRNASGEKSRQTAENKVEKCERGRNRIFARSASIRGPRFQQLETNLLQAGALRRGSLVTLIFSHNL
jgi:hypothetical protein